MGFNDSQIQNKLDKQHVKQHSHSTSKKTVNFKFTEIRYFSIKLKIT